MKSKEAILCKEWDSEERDLPVDFVLNPDIEKVKSVMDEYAKEVHYSYKKWINDICEAGGERLALLKLVPDAKLFDEFLKTLNQ